MELELSGHFSVGLIPVKDWDGNDQYRLYYTESWTTEQSVVVVYHVTDQENSTGMPTEQEMQNLYKEQQDKAKLPLTMKQVTWLHHYFGHITVEKLRKLIVKAVRSHSKVDDYLAEIGQCEICKVSSKRIPRPVVA